MLKGETPTIFGDGEQLRDFVYVEDAAQANLSALKRLAKVSAPVSLGDQAFNIATGGGASVNELFRRLADLTGFPGS